MVKAKEIVINSSSSSSNNSNSNSSIDTIHHLPVSGSLHEVSPLFVDEYGIILVASGSLIQAISSKTGELIGNFNGHTALISRIVDCPATSAEEEKKGSANVISTSIDGFLIVWNKKTFKEVSRILVHVAVYDILIPKAAESGLFLCGIQHGSQSAADRSNELYLVTGKSHALVDQEAPAKKKSSKNSDIEKFSLICYDTVKQKIIRKISNVRNARQCVASLGALLGDRYIVVAGAKPKLTFWSETAQTGLELKCRTGHITCLAAKEDTGLLVTGHIHGEIIVWHDIIPWIEAMAATRAESIKGQANSTGTATYPAITTLHWHSHPVVSLALSPDARYMFSGGDEGVLVIWQLATGHKDFVPRLGAAITFLSASTKESRVAVTAADNSVRIINTATLKEDWELRSLYVPKAIVPKHKRHEQREAVSTLSISSSQIFTQSDASYRCSIKVENRSGCIACNGYPGQLQMLDLATQTFRTSHEVLQFTRVSKKETYSRMNVPSTTHYHFLETPLGSLMVTLDVRKGEDSEVEASLKFWEWDAQSSKYRLSSQVDRPHGSSRVTSVVFSPSVPETSPPSSSAFKCSCATAGLDGNIKVWAGQSQYTPVTSDKDGYKSLSATAVAMHWTCSFSFKHRDCPAGAMSFSFDGSLLAASYENVVTLWDPTQVLLRSSIVAPTRNNIIFTAFIEPRSSAAMGGGSGEAMLVIGTKHSLSVYDLMSMQQMWSVEGHFACFAVASDESAAISCRSSSSNTRDKTESLSASLAWIAVSVKSGVSTSEKIEDEDISTVSLEEENKIQLFGCYSAEPLCVQNIYSKATSMTFWSNQRDPTSSLSSGLVVLTDQGEVLMVGAAEPLKQHFSDRSQSTISNGVHAKVFGQKISTLPFSTLVHSYSHNENIALEDGKSTSLPDALAASISRQKKVKTGMSESWLEGIFDAKSGSIPPLSAIYDDFVGGLLNKQNGSLEGHRQEGILEKGRNGSSFSNTHNGSDVPSSAGSNSRGRRTEQDQEMSILKVGEEDGDDDAYLATFSDSRQKMFTEGLTSYFSQLVQSNGSTATSSSSLPLNPKSTVKGKKNEKRKADAL